jgi:LysM repeat protein
MSRDRLQVGLIAAVAVLILASVILVVVGRGGLFSSLGAAGGDSGTATAEGPREPTAVPSITPSPMPSPTPTEPPPIPYTIQIGDTLWDIAVHHSTTVDAILQANPGIDPGGMISAGDVILIPVGDDPPAVVPESEWEHTAQVTIEGGGLRLRTEPSLDSSVIVTLAALTPLTVIGRTQNNEWMQVRTPFLEWGWVSAEFIELFIDVSEIPVVWEIEETSTEEVTPASRPGSYPHISGLTNHVREIYQLGQSLGNGANVFSKVGDSITVNEGFLTPFGLRQYALYEHSYLQAVVDHYDSGWARTHTPFANASLAAGIGWSSLIMLDPDYADQELCNDDETPLECEYRLVKPSVAIIMLGTNDVPGISNYAYEAAMREIIEISLEKGIIPVISTIPPMHRTGMESRVAAFNTILANLTFEYELPLMDYWSALQDLPNQGIGSDGVHPTRAPGLLDGYLSAENLRYGIPMRNLVALQALDAVWRFVTAE